MQTNVILRPASAVARVELSPGETVTAQAGAMLDMSNGMDVETTSGKKGGGGGLLLVKLYPNEVSATVSLLVIVRRHPLGSAGSIMPRYPPQPTTCFQWLDCQPSPPFDVEPAGPPVDRPISVLPGTKSNCSGSGEPPIVMMRGAVVNVEDVVPVRKR